MWGSGRITYDNVDDDDDDDGNGGGDGEGNDGLDSDGDLDQLMQGEVIHVMLYCSNGSLFYNLSLLLSIFFRLIFKSHSIACVIVLHQ